ncbi:hypothetical protein [Paraburkholderia caribensis]|uniref:hypothetical protein n=1 Tax=Paraburkholderia caribensis TaxID=75105 RepID=UPI000720C23D|nr:hypothetical protein [Paraburkholderia caribensis]ALP65196.1 hypothetical protein AN416_21610 [Paraburkholderia caribensis]AUT53651.1 hypothetical protein C2L66_16880 [Paraburkholderia caribensis]
MKRARFDDDHAERQLVRLERELFVGFYSIRKLLDTFKVSPATRRMKLVLNWSPSNGQVVDYMNAHRLDNLYELRKTTSEQRDLLFLCNQFVHSYVFMPVIDEKHSFTGVYVNSDRTRHDRIYYVEERQIIDIFKIVGNDYPSTQHMRRNKSGQWEEYDPATSDDVPAD